MLAALDVSPNPSDINSYLRTFVVNVGVQCGLAYSFNSLRWESPWMTYDFSLAFVLPLMKADTYLAFLLPSVVKVLPLPEFLCTASLCTTILPSTELALYLITKLPVIGETIANGFRQLRLELRTIGLQGLIEGQWTRLCIPDVLRIFWIIRFACQGMLLCFVRVMANHEQSGHYYITSSDGWFIARTLMIHGCDTQIALLGMTSIVSCVAHFVGAGFASFLSLADEENPNMGAVSATLFFLLALQTGLTSLAPEKRLLRLYRNFCLLTTAVLHLIHSMVNPVLMSLSASHSDSIRKHLRALLVCALLVFFPAWLLVYLWSHHVTGTWMLAVTAFSIEVIVKVVVSLCQYILFMSDASRETFWEELDDYIYYVRSTGSTIEFLFGIFLFCNGGWILLFESGGFIRACMMCIHAYYNIWIQAKDGWKTFIRRRTAVNKINSLPCATAEQLTAHNDVCAICYQELRSARITHCQHYFHGVCLRKWLYVQDRCPLCHEMISIPDTTDTDTDNSQRDAAPVGGGAAVAGQVVADGGQGHHHHHHHQD